jgi:hypothetical protein
MRNGIDGLMQSGLEQWLAGQADMREGAKKQAASRWTWGAAIALPVLAFLWFGPAIDVELRLFATLAAAALIAWWGYRPIDAAKQAIKIGINSAIAASFGVAYAHEVEPGAEFEAARTYGLVPGYDRSSFEDRWYGTLQGHDFNLYETHLEEQRGSGKNRRWVTVFRGPVIHMGFGRSFHSTTLLERAGSIASGWDLAVRAIMSALMATGWTGSIRCTRRLVRLSRSTATIRSKRGCWCTRPISSTCCGSKARLRRRNCARCSPRAR